jgi:hypothetical protein
MSFNHYHYVPCLRWKQGEYQAVLNLPEHLKDFMTPLIEVPEIGFDFETRSPKKTIDEHLPSFAKRVKDKWGDRFCFVDMKLIEPSERMTDGMHPITYIFNDLESYGCMAVPVIKPKIDPQSENAIKDIVSQSDRGLCIRISLEDVAKASFNSTIDTLLLYIGSNTEECDLIIDLHAPNFLPLEGFLKLLDKMIVKLPYLDQWRTFTIIGTSFPASMAEVKRGFAVIQRYEWQIYEMLCNNFTDKRIRLPTFGDYVINHPNVLNVDMRLVKPAATIRYTIDDAWMIIKGPNVRDHGYGQYREHCKTLVASSQFLGVDFSYGDEYIANCAIGSAKTGNLSTWRKVGTNHHLTKVIFDLSNLHGSSCSL